MKKILFLLLILLLGFGGYILYTNHSGIPKLKIEDKVIDIDKLYASNNISEDKVTDEQAANILMSFKNC